MEPSPFWLTLKTSISRSSTVWSQTTAYVKLKVTVQMQFSLTLWIPLWCTLFSRTNMRMDASIIVKSVLLKKVFQAPYYIYWNNTSDYIWAALLDFHSIYIHRRFLDAFISTDSVSQPHIKNLVLCQGPRLKIEWQELLRVMTKSRSTGYWKHTDLVLATSHSGPKPFKQTTKQFRIRLNENHPLLLRTVKLTTVLIIQLILLLKSNLNIEKWFGNKYVIAAF